MENENRIHWMQLLETKSATCNIRPHTNKFKRPPQLAWGGGGEKGYQYNNIWCVLILNTFCVVFKNINASKSYYIKTEKKERLLPQIEFVFQWNGKGKGST